MLQDRYTPAGSHRHRQRSSAGRKGRYGVREKNPIPAPPWGSRTSSPFTLNLVGQVLDRLGQSTSPSTAPTSSQVGRTDGRGSIVLGERDLDDVYGILSVGSKVVIQR